MISTTYLHKKLQYFFSSSEQMDLQIGAALNLSINYCLDGLQQTTLLSQNNNNSNKYKIMQCAIALLSHLVNTSLTNSKLPQSQTMSKQQFTINYKNYIHFYQSDGFRCCIFALKNYLQYLSNATNTGIKIAIMDQMIIKTFINIIYVTIFGYAHANKVCNNRQELTNLKQQLLDLEIDNLLIKMVTFTLEVYYLPIKKLVILYMRVLTILFYNPNEPSSNKLNPQIIYQDQQMLTAAVNNLLSQTYLQQFKQKNKPQNIKEKAKISSVQNFYSKHNVGDCPLAQSIVVGLLRSLLTICNSQTHKKFQQAPSKGTGADSYRQWQISYQFLCQQTNTQKDYKKYLSNRTTKFLKDYMQYNQLSQSNDKQASSAPLNYPTHYQFYRHKIYTTSAISTFFTFLLIHFKRNTTIQFTYLYQLISDANGILVFLKFLTDKFQYLQPISEESQKEQNVNAEYSLSFKDQVMLTVYSVLLVLYGACNNYAQKTRNFLFQYNSYLIIKKIPHIFMKVHKKDDQLPSQQQIQAQFGQNKNKKPGVSQTQSQIKNKVKQLTQLCYSLLKIQIPFFSKKMKQNSNNMKMIVDIYCQMPKKVQPIIRTQIDKLILKNKMKKDQHQKFILSVQQLKGIHNQYNNMYYWANQQAKINENNQKKQQIVQEPLQMKRQEMNKWLQENVWKFYD